MGVSSRLGFVYQQPYLWSISPSQDLVIAPRYMSNVNPLLYGEYRKRFWSGFVDFEGSVTNEAEIDSDGNRFGDEEWRWHVFGGGRFRIAEDWRWGFGVQRIHDSEDDLYLRRYDFSEMLKDYGQPIEALSRQLVSQLYVENRTEDRYASIIAAGYQSVRANVDDDTLPVIAPQLSLRQVFTAPPGWGRVNLDADATVLTRSEGVDYTRASTAVDWRTRWIGPAGIVVEPFALGRIDYYELGDIPTTGAATTSESFSRELGLVGTEISWPFFRGGDTVDVIIEPVVSFIAATDDPEGNRLINEDSLTLDLDESLLFEPVRASGYDLWEEGQRANYGVRATAFFGDNGYARGFVGRSERLDGNAVFSPTSGLFENASDYVVSGEVDWGAFAIEMTTRLDTEDFDINTLQLNASYRTDRFGVAIGYLDSSDEAALSTRGPQRELRTDLSWQLNDEWSLVNRATLDLDAETTRRSETGFLYQDECSQFEILYQREDIGIADLGPSESIQFRITLFTLGSLDPDS